MPGRFAFAASRKHLVFRKLLQMNEKYAYIE